MTSSKRIRIAVVVAAMAAAGLAWPAAPAGAAGGVITPASTEVARGADLALTATGCAGSTIDEDSEQLEGWFQYPEVILVSGTGADARLAGVAGGTGEEPGDELVVRLPGWVDPDQPAVLTGRCHRLTFTAEGDLVESTTFTYADVAVDITAAPAPVPGPLFTLDRTSAAGGQVLVVSGSGCVPDSIVEVAVLTGNDLSGRAGLNVVAAAYQEEPVTGPFTVEVPLLGDGEDGLGGPLPEGQYSIVVVCGDDSVAGGYTNAAPQAITVAGTNPSGSITVEDTEAGSLLVSGEGCTGGRAIEATFTGFASDDLEFEGEIPTRATFERLRRERLTAGFGRVGTATRVAPDVDGDFTETVAATPGGDGRWTIEWPAPTAAVYLVRISVDCGDPTADGFRYVEQDWFSEEVGGPLPTEPIPTPTTEPVPTTVPGPSDQAPGATPIAGTPTYAG